MRELAGIFWRSREYQFCCITLSLNSMLAALHFGLGNRPLWILALVMVAISVVGVYLGDVVAAERNRLYREGR